MNNRSIVQLYITAQSFSPGPLPGPCLARKATATPRRACPSPALPLLILPRSPSNRGRPLPRNGGDVPSAVPRRLGTEWGWRGSHGCPLPRSKAEAEAIEKELLEDYRFGRQQLIEMWGHACAVAVTKAFPLPSLPRKQPTVLVVCGPAQNGAIGLVCARHLRVFDYEPTIFYPKRSLDPLYRDFTTQCEKMDIPFLSYLPTEVQLINDAYNAVVDAVLGAEAELGEGRGPCAGILATLKHVRIPIVSLDVPSGWDVEAGSSGGISPDVLVSLMAPKQCARRFLGRQHFVAGRFVPYDVQKKFELNPPDYPGTECVVALRAPQ
ncbi:yjeF N-terminal domain-containing protein 3 isoform X1 [Gallus gallus]|uniref:ApoA-I-binding protein 2 n=1 Tax=Gallus gallus TaxID=9031 RepID=A0A8V1A946_CHICK|nr:yjeF N-terminal domain-containing protein 3 isoform X1 [Gallus gallus]XP_040548791.1 yjeF N-terminal domain-containing protein 3 isoform X1 [Gallus gallus]